MNTMKTLGKVEPLKTLASYRPALFISAPGSHAKSSPTRRKNSRPIGGYFLRYGYSGIFEKRFNSCTSGSGMNPSLPPILRPALTMVAFRGQQISWEFRRKFGRYSGPTQDQPDPPQWAAIDRRATGGQYARFIWHFSRCQRMPATSANASTAARQGDHCVLQCNDPNAKLHQLGIARRDLGLSVGGQ
jgi:hypothetical protein